LVKSQPPIVKILVFSISAVCFALGLTAILTEFVPERWTRFGLTGPFFGKDAKVIGTITLLIGLLPLLMFCKNAKQASIIGSLLFVLLMAAIFGGIYLVN
jgi:hypothetical protein